MKQRPKCVKPAAPEPYSRPNCLCGRPAKVAGMSARQLGYRCPPEETSPTPRPIDLHFDLVPEAMPLPGEAVIAKSTNSAFIGTDLERRLRAAKAAPVVFAGVATSNSVEATVRMAGNLGFDAWIVADGCFTFDKTLLDGRVIPAADVHALSLANLSGEYARVVNSAELLQAVSAG